MTAVAALAAVLLMMLAELRISRRHEERLQRRGAIAPPDPVYATMRWAYPGVFVVMTLEGAMAGHSRAALAGGVIVFAAAKLLKVWAIRSLGERWTYRLFVLRGAPLVTAGPYRWMRHPNYVAVVGELAGFAILTEARFSGILGLLLFGELLRRRIRAEEQALGLG